MKARNNSRFAVALTLCAAGVGCGDRVRVGSNAADGEVDSALPTDGSVSDAGNSGDGGLGSDAGVIDGAMGPFVHIHLRATTAPVPHADLWSSQTPRHMTGGMRSYAMLRSIGDPSPASVFDYGDGYVVVGYNDGDDTVVASVPYASLTPGLFVLHRVVMTHFRYTVDAMAHMSGLDIPGEVESLVVLSDRTTVDGTLRNRGYYRFVFRAGGMTFPQEGSGLYLPPLSGGGFTVTEELGETVYYFTTPLDVSTSVTTDMDMFMEPNMHESFRWQELPLPGYAAGTFDVAPTGYEPVWHFGANSYVVTGPTPTP